MKDRFDLEEAITDIFNVNDELDLLLYRLGDSPVDPTPDEIANILIGIKELNKVRFEKLWNTFEVLLANGVISYKRLDKTPMPPYDDGTMGMEVTEDK